MRIRKQRAFYEGKMLYNVERLGNALYWDNLKNFDLFAFQRSIPAVLMDRIELKDKNNRYIHEADILKDDYDRVLLVEWYRCRFTLKALTETNFIRANNIMQWFEWNTPHLEILGNMFENPDLLKEVQA